jgi:AmiR/NasT family two-component response regulator
MPIPPESLNLLLVTNPGENDGLNRLFRESGMKVRVATSCRQARRRLRLGSPQVVVTDLSLPDGSWWTLRTILAQQGSSASLVVCLPAPDGGITDVLEAGCSAVLVPPYTRERVQSILKLASARRTPVKPKPPQAAPPSANVRWVVA